MTRSLSTLALPAASFWAVYFAAMSVASAADLPVTFQPQSPDPIYEETISDFPWNRYYVGLVAGHGYGGMETNDELSGASFFDNTIDISGGLVGITVGRNFRVHQKWVTGFEADAAFANIDGEESGSMGEYLDAELNGIVTGRVRLGYVLGHRDQFLTFVTAGVAAGHFDVGAFGGVSAEPDDPVGNKVEETDWLGGFALGAGLEYEVSAGISLKADYLFARFGGSIKTDPIIPQSTIVPTSIEFEPDDVHLWRLGVNVTY